MRAVSRAAGGLTCRMGLMRGGLFFCHQRVPLLSNLFFSPHTHTHQATHRTAPPKKKTSTRTPPLPSLSSPLNVQEVAGLQQLEREFWWQPEIRDGFRRRLRVLALVVHVLAHLLQDGARDFREGHPAELGLREAAWEEMAMEMEKKMWGRAGLGKRASAPSVCLLTVPALSSPPRTHLPTPACA